MREKDYFDSSPSAEVAIFIVIGIVCALWTLCSGTVLVVVTYLMWKGINRSEERAYNKVESIRNASVAPPSSAQSDYRIRPDGMVFYPRFKQNL